MCPAKFTSAANAASGNSNILTETTNPWWCSDGTYNLTAVAAYGTTGAAGSSFGSNSD
jgi:hypothetical protein